MVGHRDIAADLRAAIERGDYPPGAKLPTEEALATRYGVNRTTVQRALMQLKNEGLLVAATSRGTFVPHPPVRLAIARYSAVLDPARAQRDLGPWETTCAAARINGRTEVVSVATEPAPDQLANRLGIEPGSELVHRSRRMWAGDQVAQIQDSWMPLAIVQGTPLAGSVKVVGGVYAAMTAAGFPPDSITEEVSSRMPTTSERERMQIGDGVTVLDVWRTTRDTQGRTVEVLHTVANAQLSTFVYDNLPIRQSEG